MNRTNTEPNTVVNLVNFNPKYQAKGKERKSKHYFKRYDVLMNSSLNDNESM